MQELNCTKENTLIAIGGGITQDICSFSAHIYYRGIKWILVPTTLLAMADSCIGAKCCINLNAFKNQLGCFYSPGRVMLCDKFAQTLHDRDLASGYGEILKLMFTGSADALTRLIETVRSNGLRNASLNTLIRESLMVKQSVIEVDEYEAGLRRILNYGHTFGHALEAITNHQIPHGIAVAWGMDLINFIAMERGLLPPDVFNTVHQFVRQYFPIRCTTEVTVHDLIAAAKRDKKASQGAVNLVLPEGPGRLTVVKTKFDVELENLLTQFLRRYGPIAA
jgi:3-dehydroquinate synthase